MIEIRDASSRGVTYSCVECEKKHGIVVSCRYDVARGWKKYLDRFWKAHDECGLAELDARLEKACPDYEAKMAFAGAMYLEDPAMKMEEIQRRWKELKEVQAEGE